MFISDGLTIERAVITNLLSAHKRIADSGNSTEIIRLSKYILKLAGKRKDMLATILSEEEPIERIDRHQVKMKFTMDKGEIWACDSEGKKVTDIFGVKEASHD